MSIFLGTINHVINSADEENNRQSFLVHTVFGTLDFVSSGNENFCGSKIVSAMKDNLLTFPWRLTCIQKSIHFKTAQHKQKYWK